MTNITNGGNFLASAARYEAIRRREDYVGPIRRVLAAVGVAFLAIAIGVTVDVMMTATTVNGVRSGSALLALLLLIPFCKLLHMAATGRK